MPENIFTSFTENSELNIVLTAAQRNGWETQLLLNGEHVLAEIQKNGLRYRVKNGVVSVNSSVATAISQNKYFTNQVLRQWIPYTTDCRLFPVDGYDTNELTAFLAQHTRVVVKAVDENNGIGVFTSLTALAEVEAAIASLRRLKATRFLLENHVETTREYRVLLWKGQVIDVLERIPGYVTGDGHSSIRRLIEEKNHEREHEFPGVPYEGILLDDSLTHYLQLTHRQLDDVPAVGEHVRVREMCNMSQGGETRRIAQEAIAAEYHKIFEDVYKATWLNYCGADLITTSIEEKPVEGKTVINELNGAPSWAVALFADVREGRPYYGAGKILERMEADPIQAFLPRTE